MPTGVVVACQNERSQLQNRENCMRMLRAKLVELKERQHAEKHRGHQGRADEDRVGQPDPLLCLHALHLVKDHRTGYENGNIPAVMDGDLDGFINAYLTASATGELKK